MAGVYGCGGITVDSDSGSEKKTELGECELQELQRLLSKDWVLTRRRVPRALQWLGVLALRRRSRWRSRRAAGICKPVPGNQGQKRHTRALAGTMAGAGPWQLDTTRFDKLSCRSLQVWRLKQQTDGAPQRCCS